MQTYHFAIITLLPGPKIAEFAYFKELSHNFYWLKNKKCAFPPFLGS